jgi:hypothetical protein
VRVNIRPFRSRDAEAAREVHKAFAGREDEAHLVESLHRADAAPLRKGLGPGGGRRVS